MTAKTTVQLAERTLSSPCALTQCPRAKKAIRCIVFFAAKSPQNVQCRECRIASGPKGSGARSITARSVDRCISTAGGG
eukprot:3397780-Prymnesium_polylepis.1